MMAPVESRMTALQSTVHPTELTSDLQAEIAADRLHPDSVQSVPVAPGALQKLRLTWQAAGVIPSSVMPSDSSAGASLVASLVASFVASFEGADSASGFPGDETSVCDVGELTPQATTTTAEMNMPNVRTIWLAPFCSTTQTAPERRRDTIERKSDLTGTASSTPPPLPIGSQASVRMLTNRATTVHAAA